MAKLYDYDSFIISNYEKASGSKLFIDVNGKTFGYKGDLDSGYFLEELVYSVLKESKIDIDFNEAPLQCLISFPEKIVLISLKDAAEYEEAVVYFTSEFKQDEIYGFLSELILDDETVIFIDYKDEDDSFKVSRNIDEFQSIVASSSVKLTKVVTGFYKIANQIKKIRGDLLGVLILLTLPAFLYFGLSNTIATKDEKELKKLEIQYKLLEAQHSQEIESLQRSGNKYREIENTKDFFANKEEAVDIINKIIPGNLIKEDPEDSVFDPSSLDNAIPDMKIDGKAGLPELKVSGDVPKNTPLPTFDTKK